MKSIVWTIAFALWTVTAFRVSALDAGVAVEDITPPTGFPMWGYGARHDMPSTGVLDPLYAKAIVLVAGDEKLALVGLDLGRAPTRASMARIRQAARRDAGVQAVMIVGSHTHHGPVIETEDWPTPEKPYVRDLESKIVSAIVRAAAATKPVRMGFGRKPIPYNRNRHWKGEPKPIDPDLTVIRLDAMDGKPLAVLVNFAAHPTITRDELLEFSADWPGFMMKKVEGEFGGVCAFFQGAAGDLTTKDSKGDPKFYGERIADEVLALLGEIETMPAPNARIQVVEDDFRFKSRVDFSSPMIQALYKQAFYPALIDAYIAEFSDGIRPHLTTALVGEPGAEIALVGVSMELFSDHAVQLKRRSPIPTVVFGYTNGHQLYAPTIEAAAQGGYGGSPEVAPIEVGAGEAIMNRALIRIFEMLGKL